MKKLHLLSAILLTLSFFFSKTISAQGFDVTLYQQFLENHRDMQTQDLLQMHPAGIFEDNIDLNYQNVFYFDSIDAKYNLTQYEKQLINEHGFMVTQRLSQKSFGEILLDIHHNDLPVFVSADAILYAYHVSYDRILQQVEVAYLVDKLGTLLGCLRNSFPQLVNTYSSEPGMLQELKDVDLYLAVGLKLIGQNIPPYYPENTPVIDTVITRIMEANAFYYDTLFSSECVAHDYSQFKPRGHYDSDDFPQLRLYFRTMMWLGRIEMYLIKPSFPSPFCDPQTSADIQRQIIDANLVYELFGLANVFQDYQDMENIIQFFVGFQDNVTIDNMGYMRNAVQLTAASQLLDTLKVQEFQDTLRNQSFAFQLILSQILSGNPMMGGDSLVPASSFLMFGQRYVDDSYVTASVVYDRIWYMEERICRLFPSTLDPMFALGNNAAAQLLIPELDEYHYGSNLAALRYLFDSFPAEYWETSMYKRWLGLIKTLNPPESRDNLPGFMTTAAWWQEKLNTQLASWSELRHDNLLYAKQSYTGVPVCSYPYSYVEPFPELYASLKNTGSFGYNYFESVPFIDEEIKQYILNYFSSMQYTCDTLMSIAQKELDDVPLSAGETAFLKNMMFEVSTYTGTTYDGWYPKLIYRDDAYDNEGVMGANYIVADIHTTPADCGGTFYGWVMHAGTGPADAGVFIAKLPGGEECAFIGPVLSYRQYTTTDFLRLTDDEWSSDYMFSSDRPDWVNLYLADSTGGSRGEGGRLLTSVAPDDNAQKLSAYLTVSNYPNPFNPSTLIKFTVPYDLSNENAELIIYDIQGQTVKHLVNQVLPAGNYVSKWYGNNDDGNPVASGIYLYRLKIADRQAVGKMNLVR